MVKLENKTNVTYIHSDLEHAYCIFTDVFYGHLKDKIKDFSNLIILCIGTDRVTGDCLGPLIGYKLYKHIDVYKNVILYGTLEEPVHAKNIAETIDTIYEKHKNPLIVAIDASLGRMESIGYITLGEGAVRPGAGLNKDLPCVGDIFITGIVNYSDSMDIFVLQNTRLSIVMKMADIIYKGIIDAILMYKVQHDNSLF